MTKISLLLTITSLTLFGKTFSVEIEPFRSHFITSQVTGNVALVNFESEDQIYIAKKIPDPIILIDNFNEITEKATLDAKIFNFEKMLNLKLENLNGIKNSTSKSILEKNNSELDFLSLQNQYLDMTQRQKFLAETLERKFITANNLYINEILVSVGEFVSPGTKLLKVSNVSKILFRVFLSADEVLQLKHKGFTLNDKIDKNWTIRSSSLVKNEQYISSYEVIFEAPYADNKIGQIIKFDLVKNTK